MVDGSDLIERLRFFSELSSILIMVAGVIVFLGWAFDISILKSPGLGFSTIKTNVAVAIILIGLSLWLMQTKRTTRNMRSIAQISAIIVFLIGFLTLIEYLSGINLGIDQIFFKELPGALYASSPNRMALVVAIYFIFIGPSLLFLSRNTLMSIKWSQIIAILTVFLIGIPLLGFLYGAYSLYFIPNYTGTAIYAVLLLFWASLSILYARPDKGVVLEITSNQIGSYYSRRILPILIFYTIFISFIIILCLNAGLFHVSLGISLLVLSTLVVYSILFWWFAIKLNRSDFDCSKAEELLNEHLVSLESIVKKRTNELSHANVVLKAEIKERERMEKIIRDNILRMNVALESADMGAWDLDLVNDTSIRTLDHDIIFGYDTLLPEWGTKIFFEHILPEDREYVQKRFEKSYETNKLYFQCRIIRADKKIRWIEVYGNVYKNDKDIPIRILGVISDITERKKAETKLFTVLEEKELLLREIHHRVKNNMQIISSLINMQSSQVIDKRDAKLFTVVQDRVKSMALIHAKLYQSEDLSSIKLKDYIETLTSELLITYAVNSNIKLTINIDDISLNMETAIPLGLIINELFTNSLKHAFPDNKGEISIKIHTKDEKIELLINDNGVGLLEDFDINNPKKLGLQLVNSLVEQIEGTIELERKHGTEFKIIFKELKYKERL